MSRIHALSDSLINKIAAGEVIERPASVLKELLENGVDAGATRIDVTVEDGGKRLVRVADDGCGMTEAELALAVQPHTTSKIATEDDLFNIGTMGFRGEALPSIASVSQLRMVSRVTDDPGGHEISVSGGQVEGPKPVAAPPGTTVEVRELFFNVPARRKFLRTTNTEMNHLTEQLVRIGLAYPHVHLTCTNNGRRTHDLPTCGDANVGRALRRRIGDLFSPELAAASIEIDRRERGLHVFGWVAPPNHTRGTAAWQYTWLNGRFIRDRFVQHAIREAYRGLLPEGRFPVVFLFLETDPADVDVNVHPTKIEVRFRDSNLVHSQVLAALRETFLSRDLTPRLDQTRLDDRPFAGHGSSAAAEGTVGPMGRGRLGGGGGSPPPSPAEQQQIREALADLLKQTPPAPGRPVAAGAGLPEADRIEPEPARPVPPDPSSGAQAVQFHNTYLVAETEDGLIIVDQHALHERIIYQQLVDRIGCGKLESQRLLLTETVDVTPTELACLESFAELFDRLGLDLEPFGPTTVAIRAIPAALNDVDAATWVSQVLARLADKPDQTATDEFIHELLDMMACRAAVKAGEPLAPEEIQSLLAQRTVIEKGSACPHGRPTTLRLTLGDLARQFKRT